MRTAAGISFEQVKQWCECFLAHYGGLCRHFDDSRLDKLRTDIWARIAADQDLASVADGIDVDLKGVFQELVDEDGSIRGH